MALATDRTQARIIGRYALHAELASGGMATVHFGRLLGPVGFSRTVAIKRLHPQFAKDPEFVSMFLDEARLAARIRHPNVVPTLDVVATQGELFLVMEYVQGESLARLVRAVHTQERTISPNVVAAVMSGVLHGLHAAHEARNERGEPLGIVHRDVSPQNVLVGTDGVARVLDFGVAKAAGRLQTTREGQIKGKLAYMPPEQLRGGSVTRASDIYAAAVVLWEALTAERLFTGDNEGSILAKILEASVPPPSQLARGLPPSLDAVVLRGIDRDPGKRFTTAREMALALERSVSLAPPSEVGEWVEATAGAVLSMRAGQIADIESTSSVNSVGSIPVGDAGPPVTGSRRKDLRAPLDVAEERSGASQLSSISVSKSGLPHGAPQTGSRRTQWIAIAVAVASVAALAIVLVVGGPRQAPATGAGGAAPPASGATAPVSSIGPPPAPPPTGSPDPAAGSASVGAPPVATQAQTHAPPPKRPRPTPPAKAASCDPPFTLDAAGHKHYKLECL